MANFAVSASEEVILKGRELLEKMAEPGEKQADVLEKIFRIVEEHCDGETMRKAGIDVQAIDSSLANIRGMFLATVSGKEQIIAEKDAKIAEIKGLKDQLEKDLRGQLAAATAAKEQALKGAEAAAKAAAQAEKDARAAKEQAETKSSLAAEKDRTIATLADKLSAAEAKAAGYDDLSKKEAEAQERIREMDRTIAAGQAESARKLKDLTAEFDRRTADADREHAAALEAAARELKAEKEAAARALADAGKDHETAIRELTARMERKISEAEKDAALAAANAVAEKEREMTEKMATLQRDADKEVAEKEKENAVLRTRVEFLEAQIKSLEARISR